MKLSPLSVVAVLANTASFAVSAEATLGFEDELSSEQGQRHLTCYPKCNQVRVCKEDIDDKCPDGPLDFNDECFSSGDKAPYIGKLPAYGVNITANKRISARNGWKSSNFNDTNVARIFHSGDQGCAKVDAGLTDRDLMSPNERFCTKDDLNEHPLPLYNKDVYNNGCPEGYWRGLGTFLVSSSQSLFCEGRPTEPSVKNQ